MNFSVNRWESTLRRLSDPILIFEGNPCADGGRRIVFANDSFLQMSGYSESELVGRTRTFLHGPGSDPEELRRIRAALDEHKPIRSEVLNYRATGEPYWVELSISPLLDEEGNLTHFLAVARELSGRQDLAGKPVPRRAPSYHPQRPHSHVIWDADLQSGSLEWSTDLSTLFGYTLQELPTTLEEWIERVHEDDRDSLRNDLSETVLRERDSWSVQCRARTKDGYFTEVRVLARVVRDETGAPLRLVGGIQDLSERAATRASILSLADQLSMVVESISDCVVVVSRQGEITFVNGKSIRLLGKGPDLVGQNWLEAFPGARKSDLHDAFTRAVETLQPQSSRNYNEPLDIWIEADLFPSESSVSIFFRDISHRVRTEDELRRALREVQHARESLQWIYDHTIDVICTVSSEGSVVDISASSFSMFGYRPEELRGRSLFELVHPDDVGKSMGEHSDALGGSNVGVFLNRLIHKNGSIVHVMWSSKWYEENQVAVTVARDVTESQRFNAIVEAERNELTHAHRMARMGTWRLFAESGQIEFSEEVIVMLQWEHDEVPTTLPQFVSFVHPEDRVQFQGFVSNGNDVQPRSEFVCRLVPTRGEMLAVSVVSEPMNEGTTGDIYYFGTIQDITEHIRLKEHLVKSEDRFKQVFDNSPVPLFLFDQTSQKLIAVNRSSCKLYGYPEDEFLELRIQELDASSSPTSPESLPPESVGTHRRKDGSTFPVRLFSNETLYLGRNACMVLALDMTSQRTLEEQLRQSSKMEAVGQLAGGIAHDFNNLLTVITGFTVMAIDEVSERPPVVEKLKLVRSAAHQAAELTKQLLAFSRKQVLQPRLITIAEIFNEINPLLRRLLPENVEIHYEKRNQDAVIQADPIQVQQVLMNLTINARDAMPNGGRLTIETALLTRRSDYVPPEREAMKVGQYVMIAVSDTGTGMSKEVRQRAFEPFFTTKPKGHGTGLGLATVYGIVKQMGGEAHIYSELDHGTTVRVYFPLHSTIPPALDSQSAEDAPEIDTKIAALVVEDDPSVRLFVTQVLKSQGFLVAEAGDGPAAFDIVSSPDSPAFELLVTDVVLPRVTGKRLASTIKASLPNIAVVFMSGYTEDAIVNQGVLDPGIHFLSKPFSPDELLERVASALSSRHHALGASLMISTEDSTLMSALRGTLERSVYRIHEVNAREDVMRLATKVSADLVLVDFSLDERDSRPEEARRFMREIRSLLGDAKVVLIDENNGPLLRQEWPESLAPNAVLSRPVDSAGVLSLIHALLGSNGN